MLTVLALLACKPAPDPVDPAPEPGPLQVGVARVRMPVPVGIGTTGYGGFGVDAEPSPFAELYPATTAIHEHPDFRAIAISRGEGFEVVLLRSDTVGVFQQLRRAVVLELIERTGRDLDDALIIGATHTHSGPGRVIDVGGPFDLIADRFLPEHYERLVHAMADTVELALADLKPGRVGIGSAWAPDGIVDRRCEDGFPDYTNPAVSLLAVEQEGSLVGLQMAYAIHGTALGIDDLTLSQDVSGAIEQAVADRFDAPVQVQMFNSWGADMAPSDPDVPQREGVAQSYDYDRMERVGVSVADAVEAAVSDLAWTDTPEVAMHTWRVPIDRDVMGYEPGVFEFEHGAVYCDAGEATCENTHIDGLDEACLAFSEQFSAPTQTVLTAGRVGDLHIVTFPGEPATRVAERVMEGIRAEHPEVEHIAFFGYSQDYLGYSLLEEDWWNGGYEASGALWGPLQGEYLSGRAIAAFGWSFGATPDDQPDPVQPFDVSGYVPYVPTPGDAVGTVLTDVQPAVGPTDTVILEVAGTDPWLGAPLATLQHDDGSPVLRSGGQPMDSDGLGFRVVLTPEPGYGEDPTASSRTFRWIFEMPVRHRQDVGLPELDGAYRIQVSIPSGDGTLLTATSSTFQVSAP